MSDATTTTTPAPQGAPTGGASDTGDSRGSRLLREITTGNAAISVLAVVLALVVSGLLIGFTDPDVQATTGYFFSRPSDFFQAFWASVGGSYSSLFQGAVYNFRVDGFAAGIRPLTETLNYSVPLIAAGLGVALAFRVGLFNIGARGQMLTAAGAAGWVGFSFDLPLAVHLPLALLAGIAGGAVWGGIVGLLKARTGAHEVILTIMLNYVAFYLIAYALRTPGLLQAPGSPNPKSPATLPSAVLPDLFGARYNLNWGFLLVIVITAVVWWLINRSTLGFRFRAVGENPHAARTAGMNVKNIYLYAMLISGALAGVAGSTQVLGTLTTGFTSGIDAGIGFDAITVALLGRSRPWGVFGAGILFGALKAGGYSMQAANGVPIDIVLVVQSLIVLFVAAPPLVRSIFRLPAPGAPRVPRGSKKEAVVTK
ncbi:ABC transporter permease [Frigoribacterium sp. ACAM 257]|uniref:ABC transporter permease n=1 Tax=Frigoribacterium sp. ACAM 257 TaxID=2508998 RepID=UPI0011B9CD67|nr:ABC transporter permease [Frigoribacterium sp. ACAM 257]TWX40232.1 ABC transporter permease [Frigoribacterium sp. ACAM 257]